MIRAEHMEIAERRLTNANRIAIGHNQDNAVLIVAGVDLDAFKTFIEHHREILTKLYPDIDPRHDPAINTMLRHFFCVGALAQKESERRG